MSEFAKMAFIGFGEAGQAIASASEMEESADTLRELGVDRGDG